MGTIPAPSTIRITRTLRRPRAVHHALGHDKPLARRELHAAALKVDDELPVHDVEEFVEVMVAVPVVLALHDPQPHDRIVDAAKRLVVPAIGARGDEPPTSTTSSGAWRTFKCVTYGYAEGGGDPACLSCIVGVSSSIVASRQCSPMLPSATDVE